MAYEQTASNRSKSHTIAQVLNLVLGIYKGRFGYRPAYQIQNTHTDDVQKCTDYLQIVHVTLAVRQCCGSYCTVR